MLQACITCRQNARCCITVSRCSIFRNTPWRKRASDRCRQLTKRVYSCRPHNIRRACKPHTRQACRLRIRPSCRLHTRPACRPRTRPACRPRTRPACRRHTRPACSCRLGRCVPTTLATRRPPPTARPERPRPVHPSDMSRDPSI